MMNIGVENVHNFDFMDAPNSEDIISALRQLQLLGAVGEENKLTELGRKMAGFPLEPRLTAAILAAGELGCAEEVLTIIALVNGENVFQVPANKERLEEAAQVHKVYQFNCPLPPLILGLQKALTIALGSMPQRVAAFQAQESWWTSSH